MTTYRTQPACCPNCGKTPDRFQEITPVEGIGRWQEWICVDCGHTWGVDEREGDVHDAVYRIQE